MGPGPNQRPAVTTDSDAFDNARLPLVRRFRPLGAGQPFTVIVNHFKSKSCGGGATGANADQGDRQGCFNADRVEQARALLEQVDMLDTKDVLVIGDLNAYGEEDPIDVFEAAGYVDLIDERLLPEPDQYREARRLAGRSEGDRACQHGLGGCALRERQLSRGAR